jgi:hypothetical protein
MKKIAVIALLVFASISAAQSVRCDSCIAQVSDKWLADSTALMVEAQRLYDEEPMLDGHGQLMYREKKKSGLNMFDGESGYEQYLDVARKWREAKADLKKNSKQAQWDREERIEECKKHCK